MNEEIINSIATNLNVKTNQVKSVLGLLEQGNTIPFIARYRKEVTGGLSDEILRNLGDRLNYLRNLDKRKEEVTKLITEQEKMTPELAKQIEDAVTLAEVEDLYRPFKPKRQTRATIAIAKGLQPFADIILAQTEKDKTIRRQSKKTVG